MLRLSGNQTAYARLLNDLVHTTFRGVDLTEDYGVWYGQMAKLAAFQFMNPQA